MVFRDRDMTNGWTGSGDGTREQRHYYAQNWRADVSVIVDNAGVIQEWDKYRAYGVPFLLTVGDHTKDGVVGKDDEDSFGADYAVGNLRADLNKDGSVTSADQTIFNASYSAAVAGGRGKLSAPGLANRKGYAGYEHDGNLPELAHVRNRVLHFGLGRWTRRDPLGYVDGVSLTQKVTSNPIIAADPQGTDSVQFYCRPLDGNPPGRFGHCYVQCCDNAGVCNRYSLLNGLQNGVMRGWSCIQRNDPRDNPGRPGTVPVGPPVVSPQGIACKCMDQIWRSMPGCRYRYDPESCNSNWFASAMYRCCTGQPKAPKPPNLNTPGLNSCCARSDVTPPFTCKPAGGGAFPGSDEGRYMCERVAFE